MATEVNRPELLHIGNDEILSDVAKNDICFTEQEFLALVSNDINLKENISEGYKYENETFFCSKCNKKRKAVSENILMCESCKESKNNFITNESTSFNSSSDYSTNDKNPLPIKIVGKGTKARQQAKALIIVTLHYPKKRDSDTKKQLYMLNNSSSNKLKFNNIILDETAELFGQLASLGNVRRGEGRKGLLGACLSVILSSRNLTKKSSAIAKFMGTTESKISGGFKLLNTLSAEKKIDIVINNDPTYDYILQYVKKLNLDDEYIDIAIKIMKRMDQDDVKSKSYNNSRCSTRCASVLFLLMNDVLKMDKVSPKIEKSCDISRSTFISYYDKVLMKNRKKINKILKENNLPLIEKISKKKKNK